MKNRFEIPQYYRSSFVTTLKRAHKAGYRKGMPLEPSVIDLGKIKIKLAMHFGLCFGVENAIDIAYRAVAENPDKRIFLLSEMIHNPHVNRDLEEKGVKFLQTTEGKQLFHFEDLKLGDVIIVPAFGTTLDMEKKLIERGLDIKTYDTTCPFVDKVWRRSAQLGQQGFSVIIHGKPTHEETRATFSHAAAEAPSFVIKDLEEAKLLAEFISVERDLQKLSEVFPDRASANFNPQKDLERIGVVNQTTMLASETQAISDLLKQAIVKRFGAEKAKDHFADTRDTLCYATNENQNAMRALMQSGGDFAIIVGGFKSSNTSHLVEICEGVLPCYFIQDDKNLKSLDLIEHLDLNLKQVVETYSWFPKDKAHIEILISAGASCPDSLVEKVINRIAELAGCSQELESLPNLGEARI
jgi:4-hydroxy-3-methylbut-2-enyl diphosphate reductase